MIALKLAALFHNLVVNSGMLVFFVSLAVLVGATVVSRTIIRNRQVFYGDTLLGLFALAPLIATSLFLICACVSEPPNEDNFSAVAFKLSFLASCTFIVTCFAQIMSFFLYRHIAWVNYPFLIACLGMAMLLAGSLLNIGNVLASIDDPDMPSLISFVFLAGFGVSFVAYGTLVVFLLPSEPTPKRSRPPKNSVTPPPSDHKDELTKLAKSKAIALIEYKPRDD